MVLLVGGETLTLGGSEDPQARLLLMKKFEESSKAFNSNNRVLESPDDCLFIHQRTYAVVKRDKKSPQFVGSDDATSCVNIIVYDEKKVFICHLDYEKNILPLVVLLRKTFLSNNKLNLIISGGFQGYDRLSMELAIELHLAKDLKFEILLFNCSRFNTDPIKKGPKSCGIIFNTQTNEFQAATFKTLSREPASIFRSGLIYVEYNLATYYDPEKVQLTLPLYIIEHEVPIVTKQNVFQYSTTPEHEPESFYIEHAYLHRLTKQLPAIYKKDAALRFNLNEEREWTPMDNFTGDIQARIKPSAQLPASEYCTSI